MKAIRFAGYARVLAGIAALAGAALVLSGCWFLPITLDDSADGTVHSIEVGDTMIIRLSGNAATGYQWVRTEPASFDGSPLRMIEEGEYTLDDPGVCGGSGTFTFRYEAVVSGTVAFTFAYKRPWEDEQIDSFGVIIWVK